MVNSEKVEDKYRIVGKLGRGSFGYVLLATEKNVGFKNVEPQYLEEEKIGENGRHQFTNKSKQKDMVALKVLDKKRILGVS